MVNTQRLNEAVIKIYGAVDPSRSGNTNGWNMSTPTQLELHGGACDSWRGRPRLTSTSDFPATLSSTSLPSVAAGRVPARVGRYLPACANWTSAATPAAAKPCDRPWRLTRGRPWPRRGATFSVWAPRRSSLAVRVSDPDGRVRAELPMRAEATVCSWPRGPR